ncbi:RNA-directed DNA polymerase, eukaryota, reverse transcriptase zinc-binding domain protein [Tanacetum coccineum]|uniref:RNA-directed DNA polymerase, eukaryota, reverse transcriptase zinc-binding domain protein n=1 Tax=Tanacetum coccineum TaxID=301880 RepID=A0ABQ5GQD0_9ASTR
MYLRLPKFMTMKLDMYECNINIATLPVMMFNPKHPKSDMFGINAVNSYGSLNIESFAEKMRKGVEDRELQMSYVPQFVSKQENGTRRIDISVEDIKKGAEACYLQLYGYFVGTSMDYRFKNEEGMKAVLESGPWMVNNVPLVLNIWEPGIWLEKVEPSTIPIWVCVYNIPMELCNGNGIGKIISGIGKPMLMDKMMKERCLKKSGKLDFARVLVEVNAEEELPHVLEIAYPAIGNRPAGVGKLDVKYQWQPPLCTHCKSFGHSTVACKVRPRTESEIAAKTLKDAVKESFNDPGSKSLDGESNDGFVTVGRRNKPVKDQMKPIRKNDQSRNFSHLGAQNRVQGKNLIKQQSQNGGNVNVRKFNGNFVDKNSSGGKNSTQNKSNGSFVDKPKLASAYNQDFRRRVLVRGSGSKGSYMNSHNEGVHVTNAFQALDDQEMIYTEKCCESQ